MTLSVPLTDDFGLDGAGSNRAWNAAAWQPLTRVVEGKMPYQTRVKTLYSHTGIYFLFDCEDKCLTCTLTEDYTDLFREDVAEAFLWPEEAHPVYFEYEVSPLGPELPILISNDGGKFCGWLPWHYTGERRIRRATAVRGGPKKSMANVTGWSAEIFIPFALLLGLGNVPPTPGTRWRANMYRIDYDQPERTLWAWSPETGGVFHRYQEFGTLVFE